jgi:hypothetical protein
MNSTDNEETKLLKVENELLRFELKIAHKMAAADDASMDALERIIDKKDAVIDAQRETIEIIKRRLKVAEGLER